MLAHFTIHVNLLTVIFGKFLPFPKSTLFRAMVVPRCGSKVKKKKASSRKLTLNTKNLKTHWATGRSLVHSNKYRLAVLGLWD